MTAFPGRTALNGQLSTASSTCPFAPIRSESTRSNPRRSRARWLTSVVVGRPPSARDESLGMSITFGIHHADNIDNALRAALARAGRARTR